MEKLHRMATALVFIFFYIEAEQFPEASALFVNSRPDDDSSTYVRETRRQFFCGEYLTDTLAHLCKGSYNQMYKKSSTETTEGDLWAALRESTTYPFRSKNLARALIPGALRRHRRGIVDECCDKPCTMNEMLGYCASP